ncbi:calcium/sodium antiporter [Ochrovirga pacifica]|uniref:calcium/sodium antiporter n=1 Tax=Ochrovirga pacifica TaxID=1042376 RepID=UPI0002557B70|nr:calcium/sodium antiporter [Ochrovirga pacifica]
MALLFIVLGLTLLIFGGDWLLKGSVAISTKLNLSRVVIGMTVVSFATSAPELIVSVRSALDGFSDIALGNVIGSNIANLALVLGVTVCLSSIQIQSSFYKLDWPIMMISSVLLYVFIFKDHELDSYEGIILFGFLIVFLIYLIKFQKNKTLEVMEDVETEDISSAKTSIYLILGGVGLWGGSELLINGAVDLASKLGISERIIAVTVVSVGTSIPELAASVIAILKNEKAISLGNLVGSNIFNILAVLGITSLIHPVKVNDLQIVTNDIYWMLFIALLILLLSLLPKTKHLGLKEGIVLLASYISFVVITLN